MYRGRSGCQVVEDLLRAGRLVSLSVGSCRTLPRRYRGRDVIDWQQALGLLDRSPDDLADPSTIRAPLRPVSSPERRFAFLRTRSAPRANL